MKKSNTRALRFPQVGSYHAEIECTEKGAREDILIHLSSSSNLLFIINKYWYSETDLNSKYT